MVEDSSEVSIYLLDIDMFEFYVDIVGLKFVLESIQMFEEMMFSYIEVFDLNMVVKDQVGIVFEVYKIKGVVGLIGFKYI